VVFRLCRLLALPGLLAFAASLPACKSSDGRAGAGAVSPGAAPASTPGVVIDTGQRRITFHVEVARTEAEHSLGLMHRQHLADDAGMLFVFPDDQVRVFWMKNTLIPLDMLFIDRDLVVVGIVADAEPQTLTPRRVDAPARYVLEIVGGLSAKLGIRPGQRIQLLDLPPGS
jgi:uncharacterized membrane protein (UPF0127 family)